MEYKNFFALLGGLALFLYGMHQMSEGLNAAAGEKMKQILERLTKNRFLGVGVGAAVTAGIQSSSATTVMVVGFVNSGMMTLRQAVWIIMGANIGTTITGQLIALDAGAVAPLLAFLGVVLILFAGKDRIRYTGEIVAGLGILFIGMDMMSSSMGKIREMIDVNTIIGDPITTPDGVTIIPVSKVSFGFASGGSDVGAKTNKQMFGGGTGAGVSIAPIAFLVISGGNVRTIQLVEHVSPVDSAINALPDLVDRISALIKKDKPETPQE